MGTLYFEYNSSTGHSEPVPQVKPVKVSTRSKPEHPFVVPPHLKVTCQQMDACRSISKRRSGWVCGSNYSHSDRVGRCVEYCRLCRGLPSGERGGHPI